MALFHCFAQICTVLPIPFIKGTFSTVYFSSFAVDNMHPNVHWSIIYNSQDIEQYVFFDRWMDKEVLYQCICNGILLTHKQQCNLAICNNMNEPRDYYAKWNKIERERQILSDFICMCNLKNKRNVLIIKQKETHR